MFWRILTGAVLAMTVACVIMSGCIGESPRESTLTPVGKNSRPTLPVFPDSSLTRTPEGPAETPVATEKTATPLATPLPAGTTFHTFPYVLNGQKGSVSIAMSDSIFREYVKKPEPDWLPPYDAASNTSYYLDYTNDPAQQPYVAALAREIASRTTVKDDQARIAASRVQHIPYHEGSEYRYPYEVLYQNQGICGEKSMLLALILKDLGFGSCVFYLLPEDHMAAGIKVSPPYDFRNTGYAFIEATEPYIITDSTTDELASGTATKTLEVTKVGSGTAFSSVASDYNDAKEWANLDANVHSLSSAGIVEWNALDAKYDLSYYT
jgi:hypothetical protein